jgi:hypothetical protein
MGNKFKNFWGSDLVAYIEKYRTKGETNTKGIPKA